MNVSKANKEHASAICDAVNNITYVPQEVAHELTSEHRYLQSQIGKTSIMFLFGLGNDYKNGRYDQRNEVVAQLGDQLIELAKAYPNTPLGDMFYSYNYHHGNRDAI